MKTRLDEKSAGTLLAVLVAALAGSVALMAQSKQEAQVAPALKLTNQVTGEDLVPRLDPQARQVLEWAAKGTGLPAEIGAKRRAFNAVFAELGGTPEPIASVEDKTVPGLDHPLRVRVYRPRTGVLPAVIYTHGGGFEKGDLDSHDPPLRLLANRCSCAVVAVDYRRTPEHIYPAQTDDAYAALRWVHSSAAQLGIDPQRLAVAGDSVGGNLAAVSAIRARNERGPKLAFQLLFYPVTDVTLGTRSWQEFAKGPWLSRDYELRAVNQTYTGGRVDPKNPLVSPLYAELKDLPPALVIDAEFDGYRDEGQAYARRLREAGVAATGKVYPGVIHDFVCMPGKLDAGRKALEEGAAALRAAFATRSSAPAAPSSRKD